MKFLIVVFAMLAVACANPLWLHGHDDGQWHGEGLLESQDWAGHHGLHGIHGAAIVTPHAAVIAPAAHAVVAHHGWVGHHW